MAALPCAQRGWRLGVEQLSKAQDGVHGRAQLMAHARQELRLGAVRRFRLVARKLELAGALLDPLFQLGIHRAHRGFGTGAPAHVAQVQHHASHRRIGQAVVGQHGQVAPLAVGVAHACHRLLPCIAETHHARHRGDGLGHIVGVHPVGQARLHQPRAVVTEQAARRRADVGDVPQLVADDGQHLRPFGVGAEPPLVGLQRQCRLTLLGDVLDRAFVVQRLAVGTAHQMRMLTDPDALARLVAIGLGDEVADLAVALQQALKLGAPRRVDIPLARDITHRGQHFGFAGIAVQPR